MPEHDYAEQVAPAKAGRPPRFQSSIVGPARLRSAFAKVAMSSGTQSERKVVERARRALASKGKVRWTWLLSGAFFLGLCGCFLLGGMRRIEGLDSDKVSNGFVDGFALAAAWTSCAVLGALLLGKCLSCVSGDWSGSIAGTQTRGTGIGSGERRGSVTGDAARSAEEGSGPAAISRSRARRPRPRPRVLRPARRAPRARRPDAAARRRR